MRWPLRRLPQISFALQFPATTPSLFYIAQTLVPTKLSAYGAVKTVTAVTGRDTGQPRGVAFVEMTSAGEARDAIRTLNGSVHGGRALIVKEARPKPYCSGEHESPPSRDHGRHRI
jgi:RNA recognition motif-containing protein